MSKYKFILLIGAVLLILPTLTRAQGLNWEGQTGAFVTPFAYTSASEKNKFGKPQIAFHYLNAGSVVGNHFQFSITVGAAKRVEFGYTRNVAAEGSNTTFSPLFSEDFNIFHGKAVLVEENANKTKWVPAIAVGFVARTNVKRVGAIISPLTKSTTNGEVYVVATKTITQIKGLPIVLSGGVKTTNASILGVAGNAPGWKARGFAAAAFVVNGPSKSTLIFGAEALQQPKFIRGLPGPTVPTTLTYFTRIIPKSKHPFNIDFGIAQVAGKITPGVDLKARHQFAMGISYQF
ncbi:MAG: DUF3034 family protein [Acidobacteria bacterium]|nr:DUF3034 family protein [Acidobacteriota bacterium]